LTEQTRYLYHVIALLIRSLTARYNDSTIRGLFLKPYFGREWLKRISYEDILDTARCPVDNTRMGQTGRS